MIDLKWPVIGVALISLAFIFDYSLRFGFAASAVFVLLSVIYLWISFRLAPERGAPASEREAIFGRVARITRNRRAARIKELGGRSPDAG